ncbi:transglutaminase domain-containing protein [Methanobrevibacter olleyae]|nr:Ig-like domain repeat protein [Methanobrevibacter olleyae]SFL24135.1 Transglutaminase-like superfamily protein [Methanobrevibacter olleyae]
MASVSASDVSDINDNQNYLSTDEGSANEDMISQDLDLSSAKSDSNSNSELITSSNEESDNSKLESSNTVSDLLSNSNSTTDSNTTTKNSTTIVSSSSTVVNGNDYSVTLKDNNGNVLSGKKLIFTFNGNNYTETTNSQGIASLTINAKATNYIINVAFLGDGLYESSSISNKLTVSKTPTTIKSSTTSAIKGKSYSVVLKDKNGKLLSSKTVTLKFNAKTYKRTTNSKGIVSFKISGTVAKTYKLNYKFAGDDYYAPSSGSVSLKVKMPTKLTGSNAHIVKGSKYNVTLKDANGRVLSKKAVTFNINGKTYKRTTNSKGVANLKINLADGKSYDFKYTYAGSSYYGASSKKLSLYVKTPTKLTNSGSSVAKGKYYYITLKDFRGKVLPKQTVTIKYRGKTYKRTTNSKGVASLKINSAIGYSYKLTYKFAGNSYYGPSSGSLNLRTKMATSLTKSSSTILKGTAYKVTLKDGNGKALSKKTVTFTFNGKTYKRTTNSKGRVSLTINAAAGKTYKFSYKYAGDSYYNRSSSGTINLFVKIKSTFSNSGSSIMNNSSYVVSLKDGDGKALSGKTVSFTFDGNSFKNTTDSNGLAHLFIVESSPITSTLSYKFEGDNVYTASSGSVSLNVKSDKVFTFNQIVTAAKSLRDYVDKNAKIPATVSVNGINVNTSSFAYLMAKSVVNINNGKKYNVDVINISSNYSNGGNSSINADLDKSAYIALSNNLINYAQSNERLPNYISTNVGLISPDLYIFGLSKALDFYSNMGRLPKYITLDTDDVDGKVNQIVIKKGNLSQYKKGLNEVQSLSSSEIAKYLKSSGNDALNDAIRNLANSLTSGKTSVWDKANAIFRYVRDNISYEFYSNTKYKATGTLSKKKGNCCDHANLIVALCRAADIPARYSHAKGCTFTSGLVTGHVWAQIYVDGVWYSADATSSRNELGNIRNWKTNSFNNLKQYDHLPF